MTQNTTETPALASENGPANKASVPLNAKEELADFFKTALIAFIFAIIIRTFMYEPFSIPSGSMKPTLLVGDYLFVNKPAYGYSRYSFPFGFAPLTGRVWDKPPQRGDVIVFKYPKDMTTDYIKRLVGLPGDTIQMRSGRLYINDELVPREALGIEKVIGQDGENKPLTTYIETLPGGVIHHIYEESDSEPLDDTPPHTVPEGHYFMMGDNRDNSADSRVMNGAGFVPYENLIGRADFIFFSTDGSAGLFEFWKWPFAIRFSRFFTDIDPIRSETPSETSHAD